MFNKKCILLKKLVNNSFSLESTESVTPQKVKLDRVILKSVPQPNSNSPENVQHKLQHKYNLWFSKRAPGTKLTSTQSYDQTLKLLASFSTVEQFWQIYSYLIRPSDVVGFFEFHLFKDPIKPLWEDPVNKNGGKWVLRLKKSISSRCWENLVLAILGEQFSLNEEICGAVISIRSQESHISIWNRTSNNQRIVNHIRDTLKRILNLPPNTVLQYKPHFPNNERLTQTSFKQNEQNSNQPAQNYQQNTQQQNHQQQNQQQQNPNQQIQQQQIQHQQNQHQQNQHQ